MLGAATMSLVEPDEPRCALIARHMIQSGDYLAPQLLGEPYFDKPPLFFWMLVASIKTFGENEWALRLPPALIAAVTVVLTGLLAGQLFGRRAAWTAGATFAVSIIAIIAARVVRMDLLLVLWITAALLCWARAFLSPSPPDSTARLVPASSADRAPPLPSLVPDPWPLAPVVLMYLCIALGCLTKGPVAIALPALIIGIYLLLSRPLRCIPRDILAMRPFLGLLIIVALYGSWIVYMTWRYPEYPAEFFGRQNLDRLAGSGMNASEPRWVILGTFVGGLMPWIPLVGLAAWLHRPRRNMPAAEKLLWIWGLTVLVVFTLSKGRMPNYVLPAFPPTFALLGACLAGAPDRLRRPLAINLAAAFALLTGTAIGAATAMQARAYQAGCPPLAVTLSILAVLALPTFLLWRRQPILGILPLLLAGALAGVAITGGPAQAYCASRSTRTLVEPLANLDSAAAGEIIMTTEARYGAIFYAPPGWRFRHMTLSEANDLLPLLNTTTKPLYAILTGGGILNWLQQDKVGGVHVSDRLTVLQRCGRDALVRIDPIVASETSGSSRSDSNDWIPHPRTRSSLHRSHRGVGNDGPHDGRIHPADSVSPRTHR
jgi:4-amino-4-deoxy-L-arabinose transferase-like glycosyltransferase